MNPGRNSIGTLGLSTFCALANNYAMGFKPVGITVDVTTLTAEASVRTLQGGDKTVVGDKVIPAGTIMYKLGNGKYGIALTATTLVRGECFITNKHYFMSIHDDQIGEVFDIGTVKLDALQVGGALPTLAAALTAFPGLRLLKDAA